MTAVAGLIALLTPVVGADRVVRDEARFEARLAPPYASVLDGVARERALVGDAATVGYADQLQVDLWLPPDGNADNLALDDAVWRALDGAKLPSGGLRCAVIGRLVPPDDELVHIAYTVRVARLR